MFFFPFLLSIILSFSLPSEVVCSISKNLSDVHEISNCIRLGCLVGTKYYIFVLELKGIFLRVPSGMESAIKTCTFRSSLLLVQIEGIQCHMVLSNLKAKVISATHDTF